MIATRGDTLARALGRARVQVHRSMTRPAIDPNDFRKGK
jgi:hypothetical protein